MLNTSRKAGAVQGWVLIISTFLPIMGIVALMPVLPTLMKHFNNISGKEYIVPMLLTAPSLCIAFLAPVAGYLSDRFGRRRLLLTAMLLYGFGGVVPFFLDNFYAIVAGRFCLGISEAFIMTIAYALFADYYNFEERKKWISLQGVVTAIMGTLLLLGSGYLASIGWRWPFIFYALAFPIFIMVWFCIWEPDLNVLKGSANNIQTKRSNVPWKIIALISFVTLATSTLYFVYTVHYSLILDEIGLKDQSLIGWISAIASAFVPVGSYLYRKVSSCTIQFQLFLVYILLGSGLVGVGLVHDYHWNIIPACLQQVGCGLTITVLSGWALHLLPVEHRGRGMGFWTCCLFLGQFICPLIVALCNKVTGSFSSTFIVFGALCITIGVTIITWKIISNKNTLQTVGN